MATLSLSTTSYVPFINAAVQRGLSQEEGIKIATYIQKELPLWKLANQTRYVKKGVISGIVRTIEYDPRNHNVYVHFKSKGLLGKGLFAKITVSLIFQTGQMLAQKTYMSDVTSRLSHEEHELMLQEGRRHFALLDCPNIVKIYNTCQKGLFLEYMSLGSLEALLASGKKFSQIQKTAIVEGTIQGILQLHRAGYVHRDIKTANILLHQSDTLVVKLGDLGSAILDGKFGLPTTGNALGRSPASWHAWAKNMRHQSTPEDDLWALGMLLYEIENGYDEAPAFDTQLEALFYACRARDSVFILTTSVQERQKASTNAELAYHAFITAVKAFHTTFPIRPNTLDSQIKSLLSLEPVERKFPSQSTTKCSHV